MTEGKIAYSEQSLTVQKGNHTIEINDKGVLIINSELGRLRFLNQ